MVESKDVEKSAKFIVPYHYSDAMKALESMKAVQNSTLQVHVEALRTAWGTLHMQANTAERDGQLDALRAKMGAQVDQQLARENQRLENLQKAHTLQNKLSDRREQAKS